MPSSALIRQEFKELWVWMKEIGTDLAQRYTDTMHCAARIKSGVEAVLCRTLTRAHARRFKALAGIAGQNFKIWPFSVSLHALYEFYSLAM